jgi:hypothetical protein
VSTSLCHAEPKIGFLAFLLDTECSERHFTEIVLTFQGNTTLFTTLAFSPFMAKGQTSYCGLVRGLQVET